MPARPIYLDYNATTPIRPEVADAMLPFLTGHFGNPSSAHPYGRVTRQAVERARAQVAAALGCTPDEVIFTGGGSEANNTALVGVALAHQERGRHIITSAIEHPAVTEPCRALAARGFRVTTVPVDVAGRVDPDAVRAAMTDDTILVSIMHANNEVGTVQPIAAIAAIVHTGGALLHVDAAQSVGKIPVRLGDLGADLLSVAGHKFYGPKGVGALIARSDVRFEPLIRGANHEGGRRAGTENVLAIVGLGAAAELAAEGLAANAAHLRAMRDRLHAALRGAFGAEAMRVNTPLDEDGAALPNTLSVSFRHVAGDALLAQIADRVAASAGAACHAGDVKISHVLAAMGVPVEYAMGTLRLTVGLMTSADDIDTAAGVISDAVRAQLA